MFVHLISIDWSAVDDVVNQACRQQPQIQACLVTWHLRRRVRQTKSLSSPVTAVVGARIHSTVSARRRRRHKGRQAGGQLENLSIVSSKRASERTDHAHRLTTCTAAAAARSEPTATCMRARSLERSIRRSLQATSCSGGAQPKHVIELLRATAAATATAATRGIERLSCQHDHDDARSLCSTVLHVN